MGNSGTPQNSSQSPVSTSTSHSAFKTVPSSSSSLLSNNNLVGSSCSKEASGLTGHSFPQGNMNLGVPPSLPPPPPHPASQMGHSSHSQSMPSMGLCPPYHGTTHHTGHGSSLPSMSTLEDRSSLSSISMAAGLGGLSTPCKDVLCPPLPPPPPPPPPPSTHPAFPVPMWLQQSQSAVTAYNFSHLQQVFGHEKAFAASQYLAAADPFAKAANPFLDLARMGHYPLGKKLFGCPQCRYITDRKNNLKRHIATMHQECDKTLECCGVVFKNKASLRDHVLIFHSNGYMCRFCGRNFCRKALLKRHLTVHSGQKDYICSLCDYATSHKSNLERHKKVHERQSQDGTEENTSSIIPQHQKLPDPSSSTVVSSTSDKHHLQQTNLPHSDGAGIPAVTSSPRGNSGPIPEHIPVENPSFSPSMADTSFTSDSLTEHDDLALSPIDVDDDANTLIDVVELAN